MFLEMFGWEGEVCLLSSQKFSFANLVIAPRLCESLCYTSECSVTLLYVFSYKQTFRSLAFFLFIWTYSMPRHVTFSILFEFTLNCVWLNRCVYVKRFVIDKCFESKPQSLKLTFSDAALDSVYNTSGSLSFTGDWWAPRRFLFIFFHAAYINTTEGIWRQKLFISTQCWRYNAAEVLSRGLLGGLINV